MFSYLLIYFLLINIFAFYLMYADKRKAQRGQYRISEKTLWITAFLGGATGAALSMSQFRHKTKHLAFKIGLPLLAILEIGALIYYAITRLEA